MRWVVERGFRLAEREIMFGDECRLYGGGLCFGAHEIPPGVEIDGGYKLQ